MHLTYFFDKDIHGQNFEIDRKALKNLLQPKLICIYGPLSYELL